MRPNPAASRHCDRRFSRPDRRRIIGHDVGKGVGMDGANARFMAGNANWLANHLILYAVS